jgi:hypothetical protein
MHHQPVVVRFLKSQIGYSSGDSAAQLSLSSAGVRFLGLAAALNPISAFQDAAALESMIKNSARDKQFVPTVIQLKNILIALDYKLNRAGFLESLVGWAIWYENNPLLSEDERRATGGQYPPSLAEIEAVVNAVQVTIRATFSAPWVTAFIKWSLGMPPSIELQDGTVLLEQPGSNIILTLAL